MSANAASAPSCERSTGCPPLPVVLSAAAAGIVADRYLPLGVAVWWAAGAAALATWLPFRRRRHDRIACVMLLLAAAGTAASWHHCCWNVFGADDLGLFARARQQPVCIEAVALQTPRIVPPPEPSPLQLPRAGDEVRFEVEIAAIRDGDRWRPASGRAAVVVEGLLPELVAGDRFQAFARLLPPEHARNAGESDRAAFDRGRRVTSRLRVNHAEAVSILASGSMLDPRRVLETLRLHSQQVFARRLDPNQAGLAAAVLLGLREQVDPEDTEAFQLTGTIHLLVISGMNLAILAGFAGAVLRRSFLGRLGLPAAAAFTVLYMLLVDAEPPVMRATVLVVVSCLAVYVGRQNTGFNVLALAALIVLAVNPVDLFNVGPQLSFLCVAGLIVLSPLWFASIHNPSLDDVVQPPAGTWSPPWWNRLLPRWLQYHSHPPEIRRLLDQEQSWAVRSLWLVLRSARHLTLVSLAIWLLALPLTLARFHILNPIAVPLNTAVWLPMTAALISGLALLLFSLVPGPLAAASAVMCNGQLGIVEWLVRLGRRVPYGHAWLPGPADWWLIGFYGALGVFTAFPRFRPPLRWRLALLGAWTAAGFLVPWWTSDRQALRCTILSVGHGEAVVLELPDGRTMLYDAGRLSAPDSCCRVVSGYLWSRGITHLDAVVISHPDTDHYNALPGLLKRFSVGAVYVSPVMFDEQNPAIRLLSEEIRNARAPLRVISSGDRLSGGPGCRLAVLHPPRRGLPAASNANSIVLAVECGGRRVFLPADLQSPGLDDVLAERPMHCDVVLVPHHGSKTSMPEELSDWSTPDWSVLSADRRYDTSSVEAAYARHGRVLHTADAGAVTVRIDDRGMRVEPFVRRR